jgi:hypothetical protein
MDTMTPRYEQALKRNLAELQKALLIRTTIVGIEAHGSNRKVFTRVIYDALHNDYISHAIKTLDRNAKSSSFWYLYRTDPRLIEKYAKQTGYAISNLEAVADKLKIIRDGTHFHIDSVGVMDPRAVWHGANLTGKELAAALDFVWGALQFVREQRGLPETSLLDYTVEAAEAAMKRVESGEP